ncbi:unnamed protein product [Prorocentrum cordatum]|uniref:J domain-containing protein n=1 Tax=Prorocentrum cordatum TaxID=2364126 RepID=A0ABN9U401_9DINO|nr:unnamed protein product [Polarella glacialis]
MAIGIQAATHAYTQVADHNHATTSTTSNFQRNLGDAKSKDLVLKVDKELYDLKKEGRTREEKQKYLKKVFLAIHPDKGGSEEAVKWFNDWKACWQTWFMY